MDINRLLLSNEDVDPAISKKLLLIILLIGLVMRFWGIWHGYPYSYYSDEAHFVKRALSFGSGDFNPHWFHKPAFFMYMLFFEYGIFYLIGWILNWWQGVDGFAISYIQNPGPFYLIGRVTAMAFSLGTIVLTYLTAKTLFDRKTAIVSALILAISFGHILVSKDIKADTPCAFFTFVSTYFMILYIQGYKDRNIYYSALFAGIGTATKYYSLVMMIPILLAIIFKIFKNNELNLSPVLKKYLFCLFLFFGSFFICSPFNFLDPLGREIVFGKAASLAQPVFLWINPAQGSRSDHSPQPSESDVPSDDNKRSSINGDDEMLSPLTEAERKNNVIDVYRESIFSYLYQLYKGMGLFVLLLCAGGLVYMIRYQPWPESICFYLFPLIFAFIAISLYSGYSGIRHQVVLYPFLVVSAGAFFFKIIHITFQYSKIFAYIVLGLLFLPLYGIVQYNITISRQDTRNLAKQWIESHIPSGTKIIMDEEGPVLTRCPRNLKRILKIAKDYKTKTPEGQFTAHYATYLRYQLQASESSGICYDIREIRRPWWRNKEVEDGEHVLNTEYDRDMGNPVKQVGVESLKYYIGKKYKYAIVNSFKYEPFLKDNIVSNNFPSFKKFYNNILKKGHLIKEFSPNKNGKRPGPVIRIYKLSGM